MSSTLTARYIAAAVRNLPSTTQEDVLAELKASIADAVEARLEQVEEPAAAERAVLAELGDPAVLGAGYAGGPLHLIGPRYYLTWLRLLKLLLAIVPVCVVGGVALGQSLAGESIGVIAGQSISAGLSVAVHLCFWLTLVFAIMERTGAHVGSDWDVDQLPEERPRGIGLSDVVASLIFLGVAAGVILWDGLYGVVYLGGETLSLLNPGLWPWWIAGLFSLVLLEVIFTIALYVRGRWTPAFAVMNTVVAVLFVSWAAMLLGRGQLANPEFVRILSQVAGPDLVRILAVLVGFGIVAISIWDVIDGWLKAHRDSRYRR